MQTLSSQTGSIAGGSDSGCAAELRALLDEQDKLLSGHVPTTLQRYSYNARWGSSDGWLDLTWRLRQSVRPSLCAVQTGLKSLACNLSLQASLSGFVASQCKRFTHDEVIQRDSWSVCLFTVLFSLGIAVPTPRRVLSLLCIEPIVTMSNDFRWQGWKGTEMNWHDSTQRLKCVYAS